jgi:hypothetical protein
LTAYNNHANIKLNVTNTEIIMPAIKVYKSKGKLIPIVDAKISKAYLCPWTKDLFATKRGYLTHLVKLRETRMHKRARENIRGRKFADFYNQPNLEAIVEWVNTNPEFFFDNAIKNGWSHDHAKLLKVRNEFWVKITYLDLRYSDSVGNSHSAPRGRKQNWGGRDIDTPNGYPGFSGYIEYQMSHDIGFGSNLFRDMGINTGTGSGGSDHRYGYDVKMFIEDFPLLEKFIEDDRLRYDKENLLEMIKNEHKPYDVTKYTYGTARYFKR